MGVLAESVSRRIAARCKTSTAVVVVSRNGKPSRVYDLRTYLQRAEQTKRSKPWKGRKRMNTIDPLGAVDGRVVGSLRREAIYD